MAEHEDPLRRANRDAVRETWQREAGREAEEPSPQEKERVREEAAERARRERAGDPSTQSDG